MFPDRFEVFSVGYKPECNVKRRGRFYARMAAESRAVEVRRDARFQSPYAYVVEINTGKTVYVVGDDPRAES